MGKRVLRQRERGATSLYFGVGFGIQFALRAGQEHRNLRFKNSQFYNGTNRIMNSYTVWNI